MPVAVASFGGRLFVAEYEGRRLQVLEPDGHPLQVYAPKEWGQLLSVYVSLDAVRVSDETLNTVHVMTFRSRRLAAEAEQAQSELQPQAGYYRVQEKRDEL